jgi:protein-disulfide isomerase
MRGGADWLRPDPADDHVLGGESADLFLVEYGDFECPYSRAAYQSVQEALRRFDGRLLFAFRHFPLTEIHPHAMAASLAAEAAAAQGKYWPMHDELFARQDALDESGLRSIAGAVGLETSAFEADRDSERARDRVRRDVESGTRAQVPGTPALFIDGRLHAGSYREDALAAALEQSGAAGAAPE